MNQGLRTMPILSVNDMADAIAFYTEGLGFSLAGTWQNDDGTPSFSIVQLDQITLGLAAGSSVPKPDGWSAYLYLADIDAYSDQIQAKGVKLFRGPENSFYHCREIEVSDPSGNTLCFAQDLKPGADGPGL